MTAARGHQKSVGSSLSAKLSSSQVMDQNHMHLSPLGAPGAIGASTAGQEGSPLSSLSLMGGGSGGRGGEAPSLDLPSHLWAALEHRWALTTGDGGGSGGGGDDVAGGSVLLSIDDEMDGHPCMVPLVLLLERACKVEDGQAQGAMPEWAASLLRVLRSEVASRWAGMEKEMCEREGWGSECAVRGCMAMYMAFE